MVSTERCEEIAKEEYSFFVANEGWLEIKEVVQSRLVPGFGKKLSSLLYNCLSSYDEETIYFEDNVRSAKRQQLEEKLKQLVQPAYQLMLEHIQAGAKDNFKKALHHALAKGQGFAVVARDCTNKFLKIFDGQLEDAVIYQANWDSDKVRDKFSRDINSYISGFEMGDQFNEDMISVLKNYSRGIIDQKTREESKRVSYHMKERFTSIFNYDNGSMARVWTGKEENLAIAISAHLCSLKLLSVFAAIRLDGDTDTIEDTLELRLLGPYKGTLKTSQDPLASKTWKEVGATNTLISSIECNLLWNQFLKETGDTITQALAFQEVKKRKISSCYITLQISTEDGATTSSSSCAMSSSLDAIIGATKVPTKKRSKRGRIESIANLMTPNNIHSFLQFPNNIKGERQRNYQEKLAALRSRQIEPARTIDWELLEQFNLADEIRGLLGIECTNGEVDIKSSEWVNLFSIVEPIYQELCLEFFATYQFNEKSRDYTDDKALTFRLGGSYHHCTVKEFGVRMGLYPQALADNPNFLHFMKCGEVAPEEGFNYERFWSTIAKSNNDINPLRESDIRCPVHRILHRMLSYSITGRKKTNGVTKMDLWYLYNFLNKDKHCNAAHCRASYLTEPVGRFKMTRIYGGHFVTRLAKSYPFFTNAVRLQLTQVQPMTLIDHASLIRMNILPKDVRSGVLKLCDPLDSEDSEDEGLDEDEDEEAPPTQKRDPAMPDVGARVVNMERDIATMKGTLDLEDSEDEGLYENEDEEAPPTQERDTTMPDIGVRVANMERDIASMKGTLDWLQRTMIRVVNHLHVPPEPPDDEAGPSTIQQSEFSLFDVD